MGGMVLGYKEDLLTDSNILLAVNEITHDEIRTQKSTIISLHC